MHYVNLRDGSTSMTMGGGEGQESFRPTVGHFDQLLVILIKVKCTVGQFLLSY